MSAKTSIAWTDSTWPIVNGCRRVSKGCEGCYAERLEATRLRNLPKYAGLAKMTPGGPRWTGGTRLWEPDLLLPFRWVGHPRRIFVADMGDLFYEAVPQEDIDCVFAVMALLPQHTFQVLTKRPARMREYVTRFVDDARGEEVVRNLLTRLRELGPAHLAAADTFLCGDGIEYPLPHVMLGTSVEDQATADERLPELVATPAGRRFVSLEPMLGQTYFLPYLRGATRSDVHTEIPDDRPLAIHQVIFGGESGPKARPCHPEWIRDGVKQCRAAGVAPFVKQLGAWREEMPLHYCRVSSKRWSHESVRFQPDGHEYRSDEPDTYADPGMVTLYRHGDKGDDPAKWPEDLRVQESPS